MRNWRMWELLVVVVIAAEIALAQAPKVPGGSPRDRALAIEKRIEAKGAAKTPDTAAKPAEEAGPKVSDALHAKIRDIQLHQAQMNQAYMQLQQQFAKLQEEFPRSLQELTQAMDAAYAEAGVKREEWTLNPDTLQFEATKKAEPAKAAAQ